MKKVRVDFQSSEEYEVIVVMHQWPVPSPVHFFIVEDVVTDLARWCVKRVAVCMSPDV